MAPVKVVDPTGREVGEAVLDDSIFGVAPNIGVMHQVVTAQLAARRAGTHSTKGRAEVAGGGAKPWRQKGTGRARHGSIRSPQWRGGGAAHGPKPRGYRQRTPKKMKRLALASALSDRARSGSVIVVDRWSFEAPRTRDAVAALPSHDGNGVVAKEHPDVLRLDRSDPPDRPHELHMVRLCGAGGQPQPRLAWKAVPLAVVAARAGRDNVLPRIAAAPRYREHVIARQKLAAAQLPLVPAAVLAGVPVAREKEGVGDLPAEAPRNLDVPHKPDDQRAGMLGPHRPKRALGVLLQDLGLLVQHETDRPPGGDDHQRLVRCVQG